MMTITIELMVTHDTAEKDAIMLKIVRALGKQLITQAMLLQDRHPPVITIKAGDFYTADTEVVMFDEAGQELDSEVSDVVDRFNHSVKGLQRVNINAPKKPEDSDEEE